MGLPESRYALDMAYREGEDWVTLTPLIDQWFKDLKSWEATDNFNTAFQNDRMTVRQVNLGTTARGGKIEIGNKEMLLARDVPGIQSRMKPSNFFDPDTLKRQKSELGLHDLSASLLSHTRVIKSQLKHYEQVVALFMPLVEMEDLYLFDTLNQTAKKEPQGTHLMRTLRSQLTRIKLAQSSDMGATFQDITPDALTGKYRYGLSGTLIRESQRGKLVKTVSEATEEELFNRKTNALQYKNILINPVTTVNEIVMSYRSHASNDFPMFAQWDNTRRHFRVLNSNTMQPAQLIITNQGQYGPG